jgi:hypothetical protein
MSDAREHTKRCKRKTKPYDRPPHKNVEETEEDIENYQMMLSNCPVPSRIEHELVRQFVVAVNLDIDFDELCYFMPILSPQRMRDTLDYIREVLCTGRDDEALYIPTTSELGLSLAVQGKFIKI